MRIDKYLKVSRVLKRRATAKSLADNGRLYINGRIAKAGSEVQIGDIITVIFGQREMIIKIVAIAEHVRKEEATDLFEVLEMRNREGVEDAYND